LFSPISLGQSAEKELIASLLEEGFLSDPVLQRVLASYAITDELEKDRIILDLLKLLWERHSIHEVFLVFREFDTFFAVLGKRGHFVHQFEVFILGWYLIRHLMCFDSVNKMLAKLGAVPEVFSTWLITSTAHDFGYPIALATKLITSLAELYQQLGANNLSHKYRSIEQEFPLTTELDLKQMTTACFRNGKTTSMSIRQFITEGIGETLGTEDTYEVLKLLESNDDDGSVNHGYIGAALLCNAYIKGLEREKSIQNHNVLEDLHRLKLASAAIALHDPPPALEDYVRKMAFYRNPYAYILFIVDNLQDWSRDLRPNDLYPSYNLIDIKSINGENKIQIRYVLSHSKWEEDITERTVGFLLKKERRLNLLPEPLPLVNLKLSVSFTDDLGRQLKEVTLRL